MATEKQMEHISTIQRALGIIEGIACGLTDESVSKMLYTAAEMIEEAVEGMQDGN